MVRVISVHHFASQHILTVEQPTACAVAPPNRLLLALSSHCIEVRDLKADGDVSFTFPTVDEVVQLKHCLNGDYVATLESKFNRQNRELNFVRVYVSWDSVATLQQSKMNHSGASLGHSECGMVQPMRARIAGRVTPTTNQSELGSLEMIEIPSKLNPDQIEVCQVSGNLLILSGKTLIFYKFAVRTHDISKLKFIDFEELSFGLELAFQPDKTSIAENYIACWNKDTMHLFKLVQADKENQKEANGMDNGYLNGSSLNFKYNEDEPIDYKKLLRDEALDRRLDVTVNLPGIVRENSAIHRHSPFTYCDKELKTTILSENRSEVQFRVENLIQLRLRPILIENAQKQITEEFKDVILRPLYVDEAFYKSSKSAHSDDVVRSQFRGHLHSVVCLIATQQEGYLYQFCDREDDTATTDNCIAVYPFTAPVYHLVMEDYFLHALTETGLESYTLRIGHQLCRSLQTVDDVNVACPVVSEPVCLIGLRPFLGIELLLLSDSHLILLANAETSPTHSVESNESSATSYWTMYVLELPSPKVVFTDISLVADSHRFTSAQTYRHLMSEAHMVLRTSLVLNGWTASVGAGGNVATLRPKRNGLLEDICDAYRTSCALLGDHYVMCSTDYDLAVPYYKMGGVTPNEVIKRVKKIQLQSNDQQTKGLINYLKVVLFDAKPSPELFGTASKQNFAEAVLDLFERHNFHDLPNLILKVGILREFGTDRLINVLNNGTVSTEANRTEKLLALVVLYNLRGNENKAKELLEEIDLKNLKDVFLDNWELLFECYGGRKGAMSFSEVAVMLMNARPELLSDLLLYHVNDKKAITLGKLLKVFLEYLPSSIGNDANQGSLVLQRTLELHFKRFFKKYESNELTKIVYDRPTHDAMKLLVRSYLSQLQFLQMKKKHSLCDKENENSFEEVVKPRSRKQKAADPYLFSSLRHDYLDQMAPFAEAADRQPEADLVLRKLQALLCSQAIPNQVILEVNTFLTLNEGLRGNAALQSIIMAVNDAALFLVEGAPECVLQFAKDRFTRPDEWKFLIATVQRRILTMSQSQDGTTVSFSYKQLLKDILTHVATNMNLEHLLMVFPQHMDYSASYVEEDSAPSGLGEDSDDILQEIQDYEPYITLCKETMHANQIKTLITATGQQLLCTLNL